MQHLGLISKVRSSRKLRESKNLNIEYKDKIFRDFRSEKPLTKIYTNVTQIKTTSGWAYLSITIEGYNWEILDYKLNLRKGNIIAIPNIEDTLKNIPKNNINNVILHSDRGT